MSMLNKVTPSMRRHVEGYQNHQAHSEESAVVFNPSDKLRYHHTIYSNLDQEDNPIHDYPDWRFQLCLQIKPDEPQYITHLNSLAMIVR